jgi:hypothetical protein
MKTVMYGDRGSPAYCDHKKTFQELKRLGKLAGIRRKVCICDQFVGLILSSNIRFQFYEAIDTRISIPFPRADWVVNELTKQIHQHKSEYCASCSSLSSLTFPTLGNTKVRQAKLDAQEKVSGETTTTTTSKFELNRPITG